MTAVLRGFARVVRSEERRDVQLLHAVLVGDTRAISGRGDAREALAETRADERHRPVGRYP